MFVHKNENRDMTNQSKYVEKWTKPAEMYD